MSSVPCECGHRKAEHPNVGSHATWPTRCYYCECLGYKPTSFSFRVWKDGAWFFPWAFEVRNEHGEFVYGEHHIESRRAATKDAEDIVARLSDGRLKLGRAPGVIYAP